MSNQYPIYIQPLIQKHERRFFYVTFVANFQNLMIALFRSEWSISFRFKGLTSVLVDLSKITTVAKYQSANTIGSKQRAFHAGRAKWLNNPASYWRRPGFKSRPGDRLSWLRFLVIFLSPYSQDNTLKSQHNRFLPNCILFGIHLSPFRRSIISATEETLLNKRQINKSTLIETLPCLGSQRSVFLRNCWWFFSLLFPGSRTYKDIANINPRNSGKSLWTSCDVTTCCLNRS
jgi:hypothetical protein